MTSDLRKVPEDGVTRLRFSPTIGESHLVMSSWDSKLRIYNAAANELLFTHDCQQPLLDCTFLKDSKTCVTGGLGNKILLVDVEKQSSQPIGSHKSAVKCVNYHAGNNLVFSGSWDCTVKACDPRSKHETWQSALNGKVFALGVNDTRLVVCDSTKRVTIFDIRKLDAPEETRNQVLKYQYRTAETFPDQKGFAVSSIEGRVAWEYFNPESGQKSYAFKCHRVKDEEKKEIVYPVNAIAFHPTHGTFATGGGDGVVSVWDGYKMKRLWRLAPYSTSITSIAFTASGNQMAIAVSYDFSKNLKQTIPTQIVIRQINDDDFRPKT
eukprot:Selendium_serpulae@DN2395_c0_g1_i1.p1